MKANFQFDANLFSNEDRFQDPFFKRFTLRPAPSPIVLTDKIQKNYLFPTLYADVTCAIGIFHCSYERAKSLMPHRGLRPVKMLKGRSLVIFSCYEYRNVMNVPPYNEIAMTIPVMADTVFHVPVLPMIASPLFPKFGFYVFGMPVTSKENELRGQNIWGLPKVTQEIDIIVDRKSQQCTTVAKEADGTPYFELKIPTEGKSQLFDVKGQLYSQLQNQFLKSQTCFQGIFRVNKFMKSLSTPRVSPKDTYLKIGNSESAKILQTLEIEEQPFQTRFAISMNSCFDLPQRIRLHGDQ